MFRYLFFLCIFLYSSSFTSLANDDDQREHVLSSIVSAIENGDTINAIHTYQEYIELLHDGGLLEGLSRYYYGVILYNQNETTAAREELDKSCAIIDDYLDIIFDADFCDISESKIFAFPYYYRALLSEHLDNDETKYVKFENARAIFDLAKLTYTEAYLYIETSIIKYIENENLSKYYSMKKMAMDSWRNKDYKSEMRHLKECVAILDSFEYPLNREYGIIYQALGHISLIQNNLRDGELYFKQGLLYVEPYSISGGDLQDLCISLYLDLSYVYGELRDSLNAGIILNRAHELCDLSGKLYRDYLGIILNLACFENDYNRMEEMLDKITTSTDLNYEDRTSFFLNLARCYAQIENWDKYIKNINKANEMAQYCNDKTLNSKIKFAIGLERFKTGDYRAAMLNFSEAKKYLNINSGLAEANFAYAWALYTLSDSRLIKEIETSTLKFQKDVLAQFSFLSERQRFSLWQSLNSLLNGYNGLLYAGAKKSNKLHKYYSDIYNNVLFSKGLLLNTLNYINSLAEDDSCGEFQKQIESKGSGVLLCDLGDNIHYPSINSAEESEKRFLRENLSASIFEQNIKIYWKDIQKALHKGQVAIEFVQIPLLNSNNTFEDVEYVAIVLRPEFKSPEAVALFDQDSFIEIFDENIEQLSYSKSFSKLIWGKLEKYLVDSKDVFFSSDGLLHQVAIENLPDYNEDMLISDRYNIYRTSSTKEILTNVKGIPLKEAVLYGGIRYNSDILTMESESRKYGTKNVRCEVSSFVPTDSTIERAGIVFLPFTMKEVETIDSLLILNYYKPQLMSGVEASEESFKSLSGKRKGIIHIATHGYYWEENDNERFSLIGTDTPQTSEDLALTRTGLFMSGAHNILSGKALPDGIDDGILTAREISNMDLRGLDLVVLSACQSGRGDYNPDGIFGLQRGFKKAGANSILMSLWNVDDEATQMLMTEFYKNYLEGMSKRESLLAAQKAVRETPGFEDPEYWAAFILLDALN